MCRARDTLAGLEAAGSKVVEQLLANEPDAMAETKRRTGAGKGKRQQPRQMLLMLR
jgi:hypothetical protein